MYPWTVCNLPFPTHHTVSHQIHPIHPWTVWDAVQMTVFPTVSHQIHLTILYPKVPKMSRVKICGCVHTKISAIKKSESSTTVTTQNAIDDIQEDYVGNSLSQTAQNVKRKNSLSAEGDHIDKYTEKQYNDFGWARDAEAISKNELDDMYSKIHEKGSLKKFPQTSRGEAIIEVNNKPHTTLDTDNVFVFVTGTKNQPKIERILKVNAFDEETLEYFRKDIYVQSRTGYRTLEAYARRIGEEFLRYYDRSHNANYREYTNKTRAHGSGSKGENDTRAYRNGNWRSGTFEQAQTNETAPIKASSEDGAFFDASKTKTSLSKEGEAPKR